MALKYISTGTDTTAVLAGPVGQRFAVQPNVASYVTVGDSSVVASATNGILVAASGFYEDTIENETDRYFSVKEVSGTNSFKFFKAL